MARVSYLVPQNIPDSPEGQRRHNRQAVDTLRALLDGKINSCNDFTLDASNVTVITNPKLHSSSIMYCMPKSAAAAAIKPSFWFEPAEGSMTIHHTATSSAEAFSWVSWG